jgi:3-methyladenine DNA glycosylase AlkD
VTQADPIPEVTAFATEVTEFATAELGARANPEKATGMQAYMKTEMPFYGVQKPGRREIAKELCSRFPITNVAQYEAVVRALWSQPHREEKYLAIDVARAAKQFIGLDMVPLYRELIIDGAWWDFVDEVAIRLVGAVWRTERIALSPLMDQWIDHHDMWCRRSAIIGQIGHKDDTDEGRLLDYCSRRMHEREFFIRKAIGWALREHSKTAPELVREYLLANREDLSGLSYREGAKRLVREGLMTR